MIVKIHLYHLDQLDRLDYPDNLDHLYYLSYLDPIGNFYHLEFSEELKKLEASVISWYTWLKLRTKKVVFLTYLDPI